MTKYCQHIGYAGTALVRTSPAAYGWRCYQNGGAPSGGQNVEYSNPQVPANVTMTGIVMDAVCAFEYGQGSHANLAGINNINGWWCTRNGQDSS